MLRTQDLWVEDHEAKPLLCAVDMEVPAGKVTLLLGESGAGKTLLARALAGLLPSRLRLSRGRILFNGREMNGRAWSGVRGREVFYAPQNAAASFNPVLTIGRQINECRPFAAAAAGELDELLVRLQFPEPARVLGAYPHELSGGENQRCLLALALVSGAGVLILDEPTSEIDAVAHDEFVAVLREHQHRRHLTILLVSHHLGFVEKIADGLCILADGRIVAAGPPACVLGSPVHPYVREIADYLRPG
jgi:peptide/nickel transport system ATP-binding protein